MIKTAKLGTNEEQELFSQVNKHYQIARQDLEQRIFRKNGFNDADRMFSSYLDEKSWPYRSTMFDPRPYTVILEKSARLVGSKPKGRLVPREGGDAVGAVVNNELLSFQWDDNARLGETMISKWIQMDQNARKYGAAFGIAKWRWDKRNFKGKNKTFYDGPDFMLCNPRDVLANPSYNSIQKWFQHREYLTIKELQTVNDSARTEPVYKNLDKLKEAIQLEAKSGSNSRREFIYSNENKAIRGLNDYLGTDEVNKTVEVITEYSPDKWVTFAPKYGIVIREIDSPYDHQEIPVVMLRYYPLGDDLYGMNEYEPVSKMIRGINALFSQYIDNITVDLYPPLMINPLNVRMHTLEFSPEAKWLMNNPGVDVKRLETSTAATNNFQAAYTLMVSSLLNAWGETSQGISSIDPFSKDKTATEIRDSAFTRNVRDNMNQLFLAEALKKQIMFWHSMNQQFMFAGSAQKAKIIRIVGKDAVDFFNKAGMSDIRPTQQDALDVANNQVTLDQIPPGPRFAVNVDGQEVPKFQPDQNGGGGNLLVEPGDLIGDYDYVPDIETMKAPSDDAVENKLNTMLITMTNPIILNGLKEEGVKPKFKDIMVRAFEATKVIKDAEALFEEIKQQDSSQQTKPPSEVIAFKDLPGSGKIQMAQHAGITLNEQDVQPVNPTFAGGIASTQPSQSNQGINPMQGVGGGNAPVPSVQNQPLMG